MITNLKNIMKLKAMSLSGEAVGTRNHAEVPSGEGIFHSPAQPKMRMKSGWVGAAFFALTLSLFPPAAQAQWQTQTVTLQPGWNGVFLHVDASHAAIETLVPLAVDEIWYWNPDPSTLQFIDDPQEPVDGGSQWLVWKRGLPAETTLANLMGNAAYLIQVTGASPVNLTLKGKPVPPRYQWTTTGVNILGYSSPTGGAPTLETFLLAQPSASLFDLAHYKYVGGPLSPTNPARVLNLRGEPLDRGRAYWVRSQSDSFNRYFGAFELSLQDQNGVHFSDNRSSYRIRVRNLTKNEITVTLNHLASEAPPAGQSAITGQPPLLLRGALDPMTLQYAFTDLNAGAQTITLKAAGDPEASAEVVIGLNRASLTGNAGDLFAGILRVTDDLGFTQADIPVSAVKADLSGLWVGDALIREVRHDLTFFARNAAGQIMRDANGAATVLSQDITFGQTPRAMPLRLLVHVDAAGNAKLLQRAYIGIADNVVGTIATKQSLLSAQHLASARRLSATHLPWTKDNAPWSFANPFARGSTITTTVSTLHSQQGANPFLHTYHPDHDNRNATFDANLPRGFESYDVVRGVAMQLSAPGMQFGDLTSSHKEVNGTYSEVITLKGKGSEQKQYAIRGTFTLNRLSVVPTLTTN